jgi:hypothetical protein
MIKKIEVSEAANELYDFMPDTCWMTATILARGVHVRKARISALLDELEEARLIDIHFFQNGKRSNPKRVIKKVNKPSSKSFPILLNAILIGFPEKVSDRNSVIEIYLKKNLPVFPFEPFGKKPVMDTYSWGRLGLSEKINFFLDNSSLNVGLRIPRNICVIDVDTKFNGSLNLPEFQETLSVSTGRGFHYYFSSDAVVNKSSSGVLPSIDTRCKGSFVVIPPSQHKSGVHYEWLNLKRPQSLPIKFRREWRTAYFKKSAGRNKFRFNGEFILQGTRNDILWRYGRSLRARGLDYVEIENALNMANQENCIPKLSSIELNKWIKHIWEH